MNTTIIKETTTASFAGKMSFPEVVQILNTAGVESYSVDLVLNQKIFYMPNGETLIEKFDYQGPEIAQEFSQEAIIKTIRAVQTKQINYQQFLAAIMSAGCTSYNVYICGRKAIYLGRKGEIHIEDFLK